MIDLFLGTSVQSSELYSSMNATASSIEEPDDMEWNNKELDDILELISVNTIRANTSYSVVAFIRQSLSEYQYIFKNYLIAHQARGVDIWLYANATNGTFSLNETPSHLTWHHLTQQDTISLQPVGRQLGCLYWPGVAST